MEGNNLIKKGLVVAVILLFIGLAFSQSINANISKSSIENELVEITTEVCGLNGGKHTVSLSKEEAEEVEQLIDDIERRLDEVETREEAVEIFKDGILVEYREKLIRGLDGFQHIRKSTETTNLNNIILNFLIFILKILTLPLFVILVYISSFIMILSLILQDLGFTTLSEILNVISIYIFIIPLLLFLWYISEN